MCFELCLNLIGNIICFVIIIYYLNSAIYLYLHVLSSPCLGHYLLWKPLSVRKSPVFPCHPLCVPFPSLYIPGHPLYIHCNPFFTSPIHPVISCHPLYTSPVCSCMHMSHPVCPFHPLYMTFSSSVRSLTAH